MTPIGTFIINGVERVVVHNLFEAREPFFHYLVQPPPAVFQCKINQSKDWLEFETEYNGVISVRIDRKRKVASTALYAR